MSVSTDPLIFIVDENEVFASMVHGFLKTHHFKNTKVFTSVEEAIRKAVEKPDIIICENLFNNLNGVDFMKRIKNVSLHSTFIFLSSFENIESVVNVMREGAFDYIVKGKSSLNKLYNALLRINSNFKNMSMNKNMNHALYFVVLAIFILTCIILLLVYLFPTTFKL